jgi:hypothetical protein
MSAAAPAGGRGGRPGASPAGEPPGWAAGGRRARRRLHGAGREAAAARPGRHRRRRIHMVPGRWRPARSAQPTCMGLLSWNASACRPDTAEASEGRKGRMRHLPCGLLSSCSCSCSRCAGRPLVLAAAPAASPAAGSAASGAATHAGALLLAAWDGQRRPWRWCLAPAAAGHLRGLGGRGGGWGRLAGSGARVAGWVGRRAGADVRRRRARAHLVAGLQAGLGRAWASRRAPSAARLGCGARRGPSIAGSGGIAAGGAVQRHRCAREAGALDAK